MSTKPINPLGPKAYDYHNQAWLSGNKYIACGHPGCQAVKLLADNHVIVLDPSGRWEWKQDTGLVFNSLYGPPDLGGPQICFGTANEGKEPDPDIVANYLH